MSRRRRPHLRRGCRDQDDDRPHRAALRSEAEAARRRHGLRDGQVPRLAGQGEEDHAAHPGLGEERASRTASSRARTSAGTRSAALYICPNGKLLRTSGTVHDGRTLLYRASKRDCDVCPLRAKCCTKDRGAQDPARSPRGRPRCRTAEDEDQGVRQIARREKAGRDALRAPEDPPRLRAHAAARPLRRPRRVPSRRHRAEPQDAGPAAHPAATRPRDRVSCVRVGAWRPVASVSSPQPRLGADEGKNTSTQPRSSEGTKPVTPPTLSTASTQSGHYVLLFPLG